MHNIFIRFVIIISFAITLQNCKDNSVISIAGPSGYNFTDSDPSWSPDGNTIAYIHQVYQYEDTTVNKPGIYLINPDGSNNRILITGYQWSPDWSPDGNWIVFSNSGQIYKIKLNGDSLTQLTYEGLCSSPTWSDDGNFIAFQNGWIWKMKKDGSEITRILNYDTAHIGISHPSWHNNKISVLMDNIMQIGIMDTDGANLHSITTGSDIKDLPKLSKNGNSITFTIISSGPLFQVWKINTDGSGLTKLTGNIFPFMYEQGYSPNWSPDGEFIVYTNSLESNGRLWIMRKDGSGKRQLTH
jgi:TolB protein